MCTLYLVRHAHAEWAQDEGRPLSDSGAAAAERVADELVHYPITSIYASPYARARQTVEPLAARLSLPIWLEADLRERALGAGITGDFLEDVRLTWQDPDFAHPDGESSRQAQKRGLAVVQRLRSGVGGRHVVVATHGNLLALILQGFDPGVDFSFWQGLTMPDVYRLCFEDDRSPVIDRIWRN